LIDSFKLPTLVTVMLCDEVQAELQAMHEHNRARSKETFESPVDLHPGDMLIPANNVDAARGGAQYICGHHYKGSVDHLSTAPYRKQYQDAV
jgi:hypothetical protein